MFHHIVLLRFTATSTPDQHRAVVEGLGELPSTIPQLRSYDVHLDGGLAADNAHLSIVATFEDEAAWRIYSKHPEHLKVINERINPIKESSLRSQYTD